MSDHSKLLRNLPFNLFVQVFLQIVFFFLRRNENTVTEWYVSTRPRSRVRHFPGGQRDIFSYDDCRESIINYRIGSNGGNYTGCGHQSIAPSPTEKDGKRAGARSNVMFGRGVKPDEMFFFLALRWWNNNHKDANNRRNLFRTELTDTHPFSRAHCCHGKFQILKGRRDKLIVGWIIQPITHYDTIHWRGTRRESTTAQNTETYANFELLANALRRIGRPERYCGDARIVADDDRDNDSDAAAGTALVVQLFGVPRLPRLPRPPPPPQLLRDRFAFVTGTPWYRPLRYR